MDPNGQPALPSTKGRRRARLRRRISTGSERQVLGAHTDEVWWKLQSLLNIVVL